MYVGSRIPGRPGQLYPDGRRFQLGAWSPEQWAEFLGGIEPELAHLYGTISGRPVGPIPAATPQVRTPIGAVPTWALLGGVTLAAVFLLSGRRH